MFGILTKQLISIIHVSRNFLLISSLSLGAIACQTTKSTENSAHEMKILKSRKDIIRNNIDSGDPHQAMRDLRILLKRYPQDEQLHVLMGVAQLGLKNHGRAALHFREAYKLNPKIPNGLNLSSALIESGESLKAIKLLKSLLNRKDLLEYTYQERIYHNIGYAFQKMKRFATAETWFKKALTENPGYFQTHYQLSKIYLETKRPALARRQLKIAADYCKICYEPVYDLSREYVKIGNPNEAKLLLHNFTRVEGVSNSDKLRAQKMLRWMHNTQQRNTRIGKGTPEKIIQRQ